MDLRRILVVRTDRVGDVLLSTPVLTALHRRYPGAHIAMLISPYAREVVEGHPHVDEVLCDFRRERHAGLRGFFKLAREIRDGSFDAALVLRPTLRVTLLVWLAGIGLRVGTAYRTYGILFNRRVRQHRRSGQRHELEYNLSLAEAIGARMDEAAPFMAIPQAAARKADEMLATWGVKLGQRLVLLHPGSGGSARDWTPDGFAGLADRLIDDGIAQVVLSGGPDDRAVVERTRNLMHHRPLVFPRSLSLKELAATIARCQLVVTNSTGPMHMAAAVGTPVLALFSPIRSCSPQRWGPWGKGHAVVMPAVPPCHRCRGRRCPFYDCMALISVEDIFSRARRILDEDRAISEHNNSACG